MILAREDIAWVQKPDGRLTPFDAERLVASIQAAAARAGQHDWWVAESIAAAVHRYACECAREQIIPVQELVDIVVAVIAMLGYDEISAAYEQAQHHTEIRLDDLAGQIGGAFELGFYRQLDGALDVVTDKDLALVMVRGLRRCVMQLRGARRWNIGCQRLAEEIVEYVRSRVAKVRAHETGGLNLTVLE